jgi:polysaccharide biosynthesis protein PslH
MRILWVSHLIPYPPKSGVHQRTYHLLKGVAARHEVDLVAFIQEPWLRVFYPSREAALEDCRRQLGGLCRSVRLLGIGSVARPGGKWRTALEGLVLPDGYTVRWLQSAASRRAFAELARRETYALAHFDTVGLAPFRAAFHDVPATLGHHNIESHMMLRRAANEPNPLKRLYYLQEGMRVRRYEARTAGRFVAHVTCSELDSQRLRTIAPRANTVVIPNGVDIEYFQPQRGPAQRSLIFVGSLNWYPNVSAVSFLLTQVWPALKSAVPDLRLDIVGSAPPQSIRELAAATADVTVHGFVGDVRPLMNAATLYVCPIRDGGGTKLKLLDAFAMEKCVVAHPIACEGLEVTAGRHVELADSAASFVASIRRLLEQPQARAQMGLAARRLVTERYSFAEIGRRLADLFESLVAPPDAAAATATAEERPDAHAGPDGPAAQARYMMQSISSRRGK